MATSNHERVAKALDVLNTGLYPFVERELRASYADRWENVARTSLRDDRTSANRSGPIHWDTTALLSVMWDQWNGVFSRTLGQSERSLVSELRDARNRWAHQKAFTLDDAYRALDSVQRLLTAISAPEAGEIERQKQEILRLRFEDQARRETRKVAVAAIEGQPAGGLRPWREIITPHPDVASGRYQQAEFAADLGQVSRNEGSDEYRDPAAFFQRTFLTEGLQHLLIGALQRLSGVGGDPVVELQTNFGGGKTHSMLALYHICSGAAPATLPGVETVLEAAGVGNLPPVRRAVLVGTALSPAQPRQAPDGTLIHTMWGELAHQLLGKTGYALVAEADRQGVSPGSDALRELFKSAAPCLILIDEWVAYTRLLYGKTDLPGGSFDANLTFAQSLTEAARATPRVLVVASLPASDIETGGEAGREALMRLKNTFGRLESAWRPASAEEGFEIVRRRLFQPIGAPQLFPARDAVVKAFMEIYRTQHAEFPSACRESDYARRLTASYPIHPELFDRLYNDWSTLDAFQRTRGVLRLMAAVIHALWVREDRSLLILPAGVPIDDPAVQYELTRYLEDPWAPVIEKDIDGPHSLPLRLDREHPNLGRYSAARRVARTIYLGSAPTARATNKGMEERHIKLGCMQPGESVATFGDALRRLADQATHLYQNGQRYWYATQPSVNRLAQDRAAEQTDDAVQMEILARLRSVQRQRGEFASVHLAPASSGDVPDERETRLVLLGPTHPHTAKLPDSAARTYAATLLEQRGAGPRNYRNALVFLAPDANRLKDLEEATRQFLAWKAIEDERDTLGLDPFQHNQAKTKRAQADDTVNQRIPETYIWLLVPEQRDPHDPTTWQEIRVQGQDGLAVRASKKLINEEMLITNMAGVRLRMELDRIPLWRGEHVAIKQLADDFARYLYLPRLKDSDVLLAAVKNGVEQLLWEHDSFAYAEGWDALRERYRGLRAGQTGAVSVSEGLVVQAAAARRQLDAEAAARQATMQHVAERASVVDATPDAHNGVVYSPPPSQTATATATQPRRFHGTVALDSSRMARDAGQIGEAVVQHLSSLLGARVTVNIEISADIPEGAPKSVVRAVTENCRALRFDSFGFEEL
jgi:hypothetical protein